MNWLRSPPWIGAAMYGGENFERARAWNYLLSAWHMGDAPSTREIRRVTGFGQGRADALVRDVAEWVIDNGGVIPAKVAEQYRSKVGAASERPEARQTPEVTERQSGTGAASEQHRSVSRAPVPLPEREEEEEKEINTFGTAPAAPPVAHPESEPTATPTIAEAVKPTRTAKPAPTLMPRLLPEPATTALDKPAKGGKVPGHRACIVAFEEEWRAAFGDEVPWRWKGRDPDGSSVTRWCEVAKITEADVDAGVHRVRMAARAYFRAVNAKTAYPVNDPATVYWFTRNFDKWYRTNPDAAPVTNGAKSTKGVVLADVFGDLLKQEEAAANGSPTRSNVVDVGWRQG